MIFSRLIRWRILKRFPSRLHSSVSSSDQKSSAARNPSYFHHVGKHPLLYRTVGQQLEVSCKNYSDREAIISVHENSQLTYAEVLEKCDLLAASFQKIGLKKGDRLGIWAPNYIMWYISMLAASRAGLISVGINPAFQAKEVDYCIKKVDVKAIIAPESFRSTQYFEILKSICPEVSESEPGKIRSRNVPSLQSIIIDSDNKFAGTFQFDDLFNYADAQGVQEIKNSQLNTQADDPCNIQFTSGTTGQPKAAVIKHFGFVNNGFHIAERNELDTKHRKICVQVPLFHAYGVTISIMAGLAYGSTLVLPSPTFNPKASIEAINKEQCTVIHGTPTMYVDLIKEINKSKAILTSPEIAVTGGASCSPKLFQDIKKCLNVKKVKTVFGQTEATAVVCQSLLDETEDHVLHTIGHVTDHIEVKVIDKVGKTVPFGQPGELCIRGYLNGRGYYGDPEKTRELIDENGWLRTGDQFILFEDGYGKIVGRLKEMVIRGGENIFPKEIEDFLNSHPDILEAHVIGVPDERLGEELCGFIRLRDGVTSVTQEDIKKFGAGKIAHFKIPRYVRVVKEFPKTISGKIQKFKLQEQYAAENHQ